MSLSTIQCTLKVNGDVGQKCPSSEIYVKVIKNSRCKNIVTPSNAADPLQDQKMLASTKAGSPLGSDGYSGSYIHYTFYYKEQSGIENEICTIMFHASNGTGFRFSGTEYANTPSPPVYNVQTTMDSEEGSNSSFTILIQAPTDASAGLGQDRDHTYQGFPSGYHTMMLNEIEQQIIKEHGSDWQKKVKEWSSPVIEKYSDAIIACQAALNKFSESSEGQEILSELQSAQIPPNKHSSSLFDSDNPAVRELYKTAQDWGVSSVSIGAGAAFSTTVDDNPVAGLGGGFSLSGGFAFSFDHLAFYTSVEVVLPGYVNRGKSRFIQAGLWFDKPADLSGGFVGVMVRLVPSSGANAAVYFSKEGDLLGFGLGYDQGYQFEFGALCGFTLAISIV